MASDAQPKRPRSSAEIAALCAAAALVCLPLTKASEGLRTKAYLDPAHILTVCYGETSNVDPARIYSNDECAAKLRQRLAQDYAPPILACLPELDRPRLKVFAALLDAAYNTGPAAVCTSRMARSIRAGQWAEACDGFYGWYATARDRKTGRRIQLAGLVSRRAKEAAMCKQGLADQREPAVPAIPVDYQRCVTIRNRPLLDVPGWGHQIGRPSNNNGVA